MIKEITEFITKKEAKILMDLIDQNAEKSLVASGGKEKNILNESVRTSYSATLSSTNQIVKDVHQRISDHLGIPMNHGESLQGQRYEEGQYFKAHTDFFYGSNYDQNCLISGNRTYTFMIYLNEDFEGGYTTFPRLQKTVNPEKHKAIYWNNLENGEANYDMTHEGKEVKKGVKYIITSWWRENAWDGGADFLEYNKRIRSKSTITKDKILPSGFKTGRLRNDLHNLVQDSWKLVKHKDQIDHFIYKEDILQGSKETTHKNILKIPVISEILAKECGEIIEEIINAKLFIQQVYGFKSYKAGVYENMHKDHNPMRQITMMICANKDLSSGASQGMVSDWHFYINDHNNKENKISLSIGDYIIYEGHNLDHGFTDMFVGKNYDVLFLHYRLEK